MSEDAENVAREMICEDPSTVVVNGSTVEGWLSPIQTFDIDEGADASRRTLVTLSESPPETGDSVTIDGTPWTVTERESQGEAHTSEITKEQ